MTGREHLHRIADLARSVSSTLDLDSVLSRVTEAVASLLPGAACLIRMVDEAAGGYRLAASGGSVTGTPLALVRFGEGITHLVATGRQAILVSDAADDIRTASRPWAGAPHLRGYYGIPMEAGGEVVGVLNVFFPTGAYPEADVREMVLLLAGQAAAAIRNARLFERSEAQRRAAESLAELARTVSESLDPGEVGQRIVDRVRDLFGAATVGLCEQGSGSTPFQLTLVAVTRGSVEDTDTWASALGIKAVTSTAGHRGALVARDPVAEPRAALPIEGRRRVELPGDRAVLLVPLRGRERVIGVLAIGDRRDRVLTADEVRLAEACADQAALALDNARLYREATQRRREAQELARVARLLTESLDRQAVANRIVQGLLPLISAHSVGLLAVHGERELRALAWAGRAARHYAVGQTFPTDSGFLRRALETRLPAWTPDLLSDHRIVLTDAARRRVEMFGNAAVLAAPLRIQDRVIGVLSVSDSAPREFTASEVMLVQGVADQAAIALENARLYGETERQRCEAEGLARIAQHLTETLDVESVGERIVESVIPLFRLGSSSLRLLESRGLRAVAAAGPIRGSFEPGHIVPVGIGITGQVLVEGRAIWTPDLLEDTRFTLTDDLRAQVIEHGQRAILSVPLQLRGAMIGVLSVGDGPGRVFTDAEVGLLQVFADQAAIAVDNARLYRQVADRLRETESLLEVAQSLTGSLDLSEVARRAARQITRLLGADTSVFFDYDEGNRVATARAGYHVPESLRDPRYQRSIDEPALYVAQARQTGQPVAVPDLATHPWAADPAMRALDRQPRSLLFTPVLSAGRPCGAIVSFWWECRHAFTAQELTFAAAIATQVGLALENIRLYGEVEEALTNLRTAQESLVRAETLRAVGGVAAGTAHHLSHLLAIVIGRLDMACAELSTSGLRRYLDTALTAAKDCAEVVRRVQAFAHRDGHVARQLVDLNAVVEDALQLTRPVWRDAPNRRGYHIVITRELGPVPSVTAEPLAVREALVNLLVNAVDALPNGGRIVVRTWTQDGSVYCAVSDNGKGMSAEARERAFEPFFTTKGAQRTGLGLSVVYGVVRRHAGELTIESEPSAGTRITFQLPAGTSRTASLPEEPASLSDQSRTVLVIDDEIDVRATLVEMLQMQGHTVYQAASGTEGLALFAGANAIDIVFTDLGVPGETGWDVARAIKTERPAVPVVLVAGWGTGPEEASSGRAFVDVVLRKPLTVEALQGALARVTHPSVSGR